VPELEKLIHERARLLILTYLASKEDMEISFNDIQKKLEFSSGNLSVQLKKLAAAKQDFNSFQGRSRRALALTGIDNLVGKMVWL
jgi:DNA-binding transcriptional regulator GbsR (MarR family)